ncbi:zinc-binding metallopeptidase family protein [Gryllotalpicola protaetiae]|uniref:Zinc-ribbon domain-containing protein n=1 Tax=Gryllotalpicola protaetiae TaxID=2419771 RepID=A0A387BRT8_9MICO|nr:putative zinc-binding metallopeptidase [Gryllotalpicola protaetiae]AYG03779.1 hypothetical protein D7I44_09675 [Gryllotalpicola protaetiae]
MFLDQLQCPGCGAELAFDAVGRQFHGVRDRKAADGSTTWYTCSNRQWGCNWLVDEDAEAGRCLSCRLTRARPDAGDTIALEKLVHVEQAKRRLVLQLLDLGLPIEPWYAHDGGLGFDLLSSLSSGTPVMIGHAGGIVTLDLAESLDDRREALRVALGEPYRTILGHLRHEVGHYYQGVLVDEQSWAGCREIFGDERADYQAAVDRHYRRGAPSDWHTSYISQYATMHPWEDFAETFAHYLHISGTLATAAAIGIQLDASATNLRDIDVVPLDDYREQPVQRLLADWDWMSQAFNRINRSMGYGDLYPFEIARPVRRKLAFVHDLVATTALST